MTPRNHDLFAALQSLQTWHHTLASIGGCMFGHDWQESIDFLPVEYKDN